MLNVLHRYRQTAKQPVFPLTICSNKKLKCCGSKAELMAYGI